jgi:ubiquinone/menaquinone biosynthesis C-methylase UbiE
MFNKDFLRNYIEYAPIPLAIERTQECLLISKQKFQAPILDIGCGDGIFANILLEKKVDLGIDPNLKELERANLTNKYKELIPCYGNNIPKPDKSFKTIFSNSVMEHIPDIKSVLKEAYRLLDDDGTLYLTLPTNLFDKYTFGYQIFNKLGMTKKSHQFSQFFNKFWQHYHYYDADGWHKLFNEIGFKIKHEQEYGSKKICLLNDLMSVFSLPCLFARKILNRWFWIPLWRKYYIKWASVVLPIFLKNIEVDKKKGGLIFFVLSKN